MHVKFCVLQEVLELLHSENIMRGRYEKLGTCCNTKRFQNHNPKTISRGANFSHVYLTVYMFVTAWYSGFR